MNRNMNQGMNCQRSGMTRYTGSGMQGNHMGRNCGNMQERRTERSCDDRREERMEQRCDDRREKRMEQRCDDRREERMERRCDDRREPHSDKNCDSRLETRRECICEPMQEPCTEKRAAVSDLIPTGSREELLCFIDKISFVVYEMLLYLDTHPDEQDALQYFHENNRLREKALRIYSETYGPLTIATADERCSMSWEWMRHPWPWELEGGAC